MDEKTLKEGFDEMMKDGEMEVDEKGRIKVTKKGRQSYNEEMKKAPALAKIYQEKFKKVIEQDPEAKISVENLTKDSMSAISQDVPMYKTLEIEENDKLKNYQVFLAMAMDLESANPGAKDFAAVTLMMLKNCTVFEVPENVSLLLENTKNKIRPIKMPFETTFLDTRIISYDKEFYGLFIVDVRDKPKLTDDLNQFIKDNDLQNVAANTKKDIVISSFMKDSKDFTNWGFVHFNLYKKDGNKYHDKIREYVMNFADFVTSPDVRAPIIERSERNAQRRLERGKLPLPSFHSIRVSGYIERYLNKLESEGFHASPGYKFKVKGFWRRLWNKNRYKTIYMKFMNNELDKGTEQGNAHYIMEEGGILKVWVMPHTRGEGILIEKAYELQ